MSWLLFGSVELFKHWQRTMINNSYEDSKITTLASKFLEMKLIKAKNLCVLINPQSNSLSFTILIFLVIASYNNFKWWAKLPHPLENMNSTSKLQVAKHFKILIFSTAVVSQYFDIRKKKCIMVEALYQKKKVYYGISCFFPNPDILDFLIFETDSERIPDNNFQLYFVSQSILAGPVLKFQEHVTISM